MFNYPGKRDDELLVNGIKQRDKQSLSMLYDSYAPFLLGVICRITGSQEKAESVLQITFIKVWEQIDTFDPSSTSIFLWMIRIARLAAFEEIKQFQKTEGKTGGSGNNVVDVKNIPIIGLPVSETDPIEMFDLIFYKGLPYEDVALKYSMTVDEVRVIIRKAIKNLKEVKVNEEI